MAVCALLCYSNFSLQANDHIKNQYIFTDYYAGYGSADAHTHAQQHHSYHYHHHPTSHHPCHHALHPTLYAHQIPSTHPHIPPTPTPHSNPTPTRPSPPYPPTRPFPSRLLRWAHFYDHI